MLHSPLPASFQKVSKGSSASVGSSQDIAHILCLTHLLEGKSALPPPFLCHQQSLGVFPAAQAFSQFSFLAHQHRALDVICTFMRCLLSGLSGTDCFISLKMLTFLSNDVIIIILVCIIPHKSRSISAQPRRKISLPFFLLRYCISG